MSKSEGVAVGVEIGSGGTTVALITDDGQIVQRHSAKTLRGRPAIATLDPYMRAIDEALATARAEGWQVRGLGVSIPGSLDRVRRSPQQVPLLPSFNGFPLCDFLEARYRLPAHLHVDVDAAMLGEHRFGAGRGFQRLLFLTINAVVGASLIIDGRIEYREQKCTGHVCHLSVTSSGPRCSCGKRGCINTLVSAEAIQKTIQRALRRGEETSMTQRLLNREYFSPQLLAEEALLGDSIALQVYSDAGRWLGAAMTQYIDLFQPEILIFGSEILCASELLLARMYSALAPSPPLRYTCEIVPTRLGRDASLIGSVVPHITSSLYVQSQPLKSVV